MDRLIKGNKAICEPSLTCPLRCRISSEKWGQRIRCFTRNSQGLEDPAAPVYWSRAVAYLQTHYQDPTLTTAQLAQELYASREHLSRAFKECTMESIHNYLIYLRMQHCRKALEEGVSVLNACTESGFPDYSSFLKTFRRLYGITPAEYRAQHRTMVR